MPLAPHDDLKERLGGKLDAGEIAAMEPAKLAGIFSERPALHRFPASNSERVQQLSRIIVQDYAGEAAGIWEGANERHRASPPGKGVARVRRTEGQDLRGAAGVNSWTSALPVGRRQPAFRRPGDDLFRGGHHRCWLTGPGAGVQISGESGGESSESRRRSLGATRLVGVAGGCADLFERRQSCKAATGMDDGMSATKSSRSFPMTRRYSRLSWR